MATQNTKIEKGDIVTLTQETALQADVSPNLAAGTRLEVESVISRKAWETGHHPVSEKVVTTKKEGDVCIVYTPGLMRAAISASVLMILEKAQEVA